MTNEKRQLLTDLLVNHNGIIKMSQLKEKGISSHDVKFFCEEGSLIKIKHGYYMCDTKQDDISDIEIIAKLVPSGVLCLFTALGYYGLTTINPTKICVALPRSVTCPSLPENIPVAIFHMAVNHFELGITNVSINDSSVRIYDVEKTVCDCFKYDNEIEKVVALEVLKKAITSNSCDTQKLLEYAKLVGKRKVMEPYIEAFLLKTI